MKVLGAMIRKKKIEAVREHHHLAQLQTHSADCLVRVKETRSRQQDLERLIREQLTSEQQLTVQQLIGAQAYYADSCTQVRNSEAAARGAEHAVHQQRAVVARTEKTIEKLAGLEEQWQRECRAEETRYEWSVVDEWALNRREANDVRVD